MGRQRDEFDRVLSSLKVFYSSVSGVSCITDHCLHRLQYLLLTDNLEKVPNTQHCPDGLVKDECAPGFFDAANPVPQWVNGSSEQTSGAQACCPGYFCPPMLTCMLPCPLGAFCPRCFRWEGHLGQRGLCVSASDKQLILNGQACA